MVEGWLRDGWGIVEGLVRDWWCVLFVSMCPVFVGNLIYGHCWTAFFLVVESSVKLPRMDRPEPRGTQVVLSRSTGWMRAKPKKAFANRLLEWGLPIQEVQTLQWLYELNITNLPDLRLISTEYDLVRTVGKTDRVTRRLDQRRFLRQKLERPSQPVDLGVYFPSPPPPPSRREPPPLPSRPDQRMSLKRAAPEEVASRGFPGIHDDRELQRICDGPNPRRDMSTQGPTPDQAGWSRANHPRPDKPTSKATSREWWGNNISCGELQDGGVSGQEVGLSALKSSETIEELKGAASDQTNVENFKFGFDDPRLRELIAEENRRATKRKESSGSATVTGAVQPQVFQRQPGAKDSATNFAHAS